MIIDLKSAKALGIELPTGLLVHARRGDRIHGGGSVEEAFRSMGGRNGVALLAQRQAQSLQCRKARQAMVRRT